MIRAFVPARSSLTAAHPSEVTAFQQSPPARGYLANKSLAAGRSWPHITHLVNVIPTFATEKRRPSMLASDKLRIVFAASEAVPFSKTGGLADVSTALAKSLDSMGHDITLIIPDYREIRRGKEERLPKISDTGLRFRIAINGQYVRAGVNWTILPGTSVKVLLITQEDYFDRPQLYMENGQGYPDNCERYCFFSRAVLELCRQMVLRPDIIHCNDWQTGLIPALLHAQ
ncbi:MAG: glycogen/starch synthase, partial [Planctomycetaceae bacterium]|nr:glycogen/starch synthase [Planctomycetaceae bacterium]